MTLFSEFRLTEPILKALNSMGFEEATPIQEQSLAIMLQGKDIIGQAHTGTGKTAAFGIPLVELLEAGEENIQGVVLAPTRELAIQVAEELNRIGQFNGIRSLPIYGGQEISRQIKALKKRPQIIVATPGRLMDHMRRKTIRLDRVRIVVLDEADEMLNMGFIEDIETILKQVPTKRQTLLFSATMPSAVETLAVKYMQSPEVIKSRSRIATVPSIEQSYIEVDERKKFDVLCRLLDTQSPDRAIVFGRTKRRVDELYEALNKRGYGAEGIHGDMPQSKREYVMGQFKNGTVEVLVATDVAARGLDISGVSHIYNFDIPQDPEWYVHRIGRTGRAGKSGTAVTLVRPREIQHLKDIERKTRVKIARRPTPTMQEAIEGQQRLAADKLLHTVEKSGLSNYFGLAKDLLDEHDSVTLLAAALKVLTKESEAIPVTITEEGPTGTGRKKTRGTGSGEYRKGRSKKGGRSPRFKNKPV